MPRTPSCYMCAKHETACRQVAAAVYWRWATPGKDGCVSTTTSLMVSTRYGVLRRHPAHAHGWGWNWSTPSFRPTRSATFPSETQHRVLERDDETTDPVRSWTRTDVPVEDQLRRGAAHLPNRLVRKGRQPVGSERKRGRDAASWRRRFLSTRVPFPQDYHGRSVAHALQIQLHIAETLPRIWARRAQTRISSSKWNDIFIIAIHGEHQPFMDNASRSNESDERRRGHYPARLPQCQPHWPPSHTRHYTKHVLWPLEGDPTPQRAAGISTGCADVAAP